MTAIDERGLEAGARAVLHRRIKPDFFQVKDGAWTLDHDKVVAEAAITSYLQAIRPGSAGEGWRDIESAPEDWTDVLLYQAGREREVFEGHYDKAAYRWRDAQNRPAAPTAWRPLPEPPSAMLAAAGGREG